MHRLMSLLFVSFAPLLFVGCGPGLVSVTGQINYKGQPVQGSEDAPVSVSFCPVVGEKDQFDKIVTAEVNQTDGTFTVNGIPAGKVRIAVTRIDRNSLQDRLGDKFTEGDSPILRDLVAGEPLTIDLANPDG